MRLQALEQGHLSEICALATQSLPQEHLCPEDLEHGIFRDPHPDPEASITAWKKDRIVGFLNGAFRPSSEGPDRALIKLFAVHPDFHRQGVGTALIQAFEARARERGADGIRVGSIGHLYFASGVAPRYTEAILFLNKLGYEKAGESFYLGVDLSQPIPRYEEQESQLSREQILIQRPTKEQKEEVCQWILNAFGPGWSHETSLGFLNDPVTVWIARARGRVAGFAASRATGRVYFGPTGVGEEHRRQGIGRILVSRCMEDLQRDGQSMAWIPTGWGRIAYYHQAVGARVARIFWPFDKRWEDISTS